MNFMRKLLQAVMVAGLSAVILVGCSSKTVELPKDSGVPYDKARDGDTLKTGGGPGGASGPPGSMTGKKPLPTPR